MSDDPDISPEELAARIVQDNLELHRRLRAAVEHAETLRSATGPVLADLHAGLLGSSTARVLRTAGVPTRQLLDTIQHRIVSGTWQAGQRFGGPDSDSEVTQAFAQVAAAWQAAVQSADQAVDHAQQDIQQGPKRFADQASRQRAGTDSTLPAVFFPQDDYIGERLATTMATGHEGPPAPRWLLELDALPGRDWAVLPRIDFGEHSVVLVTDEQHFTYPAAVAAVQAMVVDQLSRAAPNQLRITWLDPLGHGQGAGPLLDLVELNGHAIDGAVWSDAMDIDAALRRVSDRMAELEQHCLRGAFRDLHTYNREAGEPPEAHHVVAVTGYPVGFTESAARRLHQITESGARLGVSVLVALHPAMAPLVHLVDTAAPPYGALADGQLPAEAPAWWTVSMLPKGDYVIGRSGCPHTSVRAPDTNESIWIPCRFSALDDAVARRIIEGYARASVELTHGGTSARELRAKRGDPAVRTSALRSAMIQWLHTKETPGDWTEFTRSKATHLDGLPYSAAEVRQQAAYLCHQGYTHAADPEGWKSPRLTAKGIDAALAGEHTLSDFIRDTGKFTPTGVEGTTNYYGPIFHAGVSGAQLAWQNDSVRQNQNTVKHVTPGFETLAKVVADVLAQLPHTGIAADDLEDAQASAEEILSEVVTEQPNRSRIRRALAAIKGFLLPIAQQAALGAGDGVHDVARAALDHLQSVTF